MGMMIAAMLFVPLMDVIAKFLSTRHAISPVTITFIRFAGQAILLAVIVSVSGRAWLLVSRSPVTNLVRGVLMGAAVSLFFVSIKYLPLADAIAIFFVEPLVLILFSSIFLKEKIGWRRNLAAVIGFAGALLIIQPTYAVFGLTALLPLGTAVLFSLYILLSKRVGTGDHPITMQIWAGIGGMFMCGAFLLAGQAIGVGDLTWSAPTSGIVMLMLLAIILIATAAHLLIVIAFNKADASILAPFQYIEIVTMTIAGYLVFGDIPTPIKWLGITIIVGSGLYIFLRERKPENDSRATV